MDKVLLIFEELNLKQCAYLKEKEYTTTDVLNAISNTVRVLLELRKPKEA